MFETKINFKGKECTIKFGSWVISEFEKLKIERSENKKILGNLETMVYLIFFGLIQGEGVQKKYIAEDDFGFDVFDCYDWIDETGGVNSDEVLRIAKLYEKSKTMNVPKNLKATKSLKVNDKTSTGTEM